MNFENYTDRSRGFVQAAQGLALRRGHQQFKPEHVLLALLEDKEGLAANLIRVAGGDPEAARQGAEATLAKIPKVEGGSGQLQLTPETARLFEQAEELAEKAGDGYVTAERILLALALASGTAPADILEKAGLTPQKLNEAINEIRKGRTADSATAEDSYQALEKIVKRECSRSECHDLERVC